MSYSGKYTSKGQYINNEKSGLWITRDSVGNKTAEYNYQTGQLHGIFKKWDADGKLLREGSYVNGKIDLKKSLPPQVLSEEKYLKWWSNSPILKAQIAKTYQQKTTNSAVIQKCSNLFIPILNIQQRHVNWDWRAWS
ncbi:MAG: hypothetical protein R2825_30660 [Saprospiraceae bacterium]